MARWALLYGSVLGHTERIARAIEAELRGAGHEVALHRVDALPRGFALSAFDQVLVAAPVRYGKYPRPLRRFVAANLAGLNARPCTFVSVCGAAAPAPTSAPREEARAYPRRFLAASGWQPARVEVVAGDTPYTKVDPITRWILKQISRSTSRPTDTSRDWDFTDWEALRRFAKGLAQGAVAPP
jgi:menaquinone-dependent protoporphyrinogen oxidase